MKREQPGWCTIRAARVASTTKAAFRGSDSGDIQFLFECDFAELGESS